MLQPRDRCCQSCSKSLQGHPELSSNSSLAAAPPDAWRRNDQAGVSQGSNQRVCLFDGNLADVTGVQVAFGVSHDLMNDIHGQVVCRADQCLERASEAVESNLAPGIP